MLTDYLNILGTAADAFDLHAWFDALDARAVREGLILPKRDSGEWVQAQLVAEAQRRGIAIRYATVATASKRPDIDGGAVSCQHEPMCATRTACVALSLADARAEREAS